MTSLIKPSHKGRLHKALGVPEGQKIPQAKISAALHSKNAHMRSMAQFASNMAHHDPSGTCSYCNGKH